MEEGETGGRMTAAEAMSEARMRAILDTTVDGIVTIDARGIILSFNRAAENIFGYGADEVVGRNVSVLMPAPHAQAHDGYLAAYVRSGEAKIIGIGREVQGRRRNGELFPIDLAVSEAWSGGTRFFTGILRDIMARKQLELALQHERNFVSAVLDTVGALVIVLDREGRIVRFNRACERCTGRQFAALRGEVLWEVLVPPEEREAVRRDFFRLDEGQPAGQSEHHWLTAGGEKRLIAWSNRLLVEETAAAGYVIGTGIDITEQRRAEESIVAVSEVERRLVGQELHDVLGQQLAGIALLSRALAKRLTGAEAEAGADAAGVADLAGQAVGEARRLAQGLYPTGIERLGLRAALQELTETQRHLYRMRCVLEQDVGQELPLLDRNTALHLYRIAQEAIGNAIKHARCQEVRVRLASDAAGLTLTVDDDGIGLPEGEVRGEGLGLHIMRYRARMSGGALEICRKPGGGTQVCCRLPSAAAAGKGGRRE